MAAIRNKTKKCDKSKETFLENLTVNEAKRKMVEEIRSEGVRRCCFFVLFFFCLSTTE